MRICMTDYVITVSNLREKHRLSDSKLTMRISLEHQKY